MTENSQLDDLDELVHKLKSNLLTSEGKAGKATAHISRHSNRPEYGYKVTKTQNDQETPAMDVSIPITQNSFKFDMGLEKEHSGIFNLNEEGIDLHLDNSVDSHEGILQGINFLGGQGQKNIGLPESIVRPTNTLRFDDRLVRLDKKLKFMGQKDNVVGQRDKTTPKKYINYQFNVNINVNNYGADSAKANKYK
jgi:hypothetical protein